MPKSNSGGKRPGAGRKPGGLGYPMMAEIAPVVAANLIVSEKLDLSEAQKQALILIALDIAPTRITKELHIAPTTLETWQKEAWWLPGIKQAREIYRDEVRRYFEPRLGPSAQFYDYVLDQRDDLSVGVTVARDVFDRYFGKPKLTDASSGPKRTRRVKFTSYQPEGEGHKTLEQEITTRE